MSIRFLVLGYHCGDRVVFFLPYLYSSTVGYQNAKLIIVAVIDLIAQI